MNILIANDDGIHAKGLRCLVATLSEIADVYVVAPHEQRSGAGQSIAMGKKLYFTEEKVEGARKAYSFTGTPTDCVKMGIQLFKLDGIEMDIVFSGINHGGNLGTDTLYSGTVGAAREGVINEKVSVAISVDSHDAEDFEYACKIAFDTAKRIGDNLHKMKPVVLNINVPDIDSSEIKGVKMTRLGVRDYDQWFSPIYLEDGRVEISYGGTPIGWDDPNSKAKGMSDVIANKEGYVTITPIGYDLTQEDVLESEFWGIYK